MSEENKSMSWHKTTFPSTSAINPDVVNIGDLFRASYERANNPQGAGMFHAKRGIPDAPGAILIVYLSPAASEISPEIFASYTFEPCGVPACDEQNMAFVVGDPWTMTLLKEKYEEEQPQTEETLTAQAEEPPTAQTEEAPTAQTEQAQTAQSAS